MTARQMILDYEVSDRRLDLNVEDGRVSDKWARDWMQRETSSQPSQGVVDRDVGVHPSGPTCTRREEVCWELEVIPQGCCVRSVWNDFGNSPTTPTCTGSSEEGDSWPVTKHQMWQLKRVSPMIVVYACSNSNVMIWILCKLQLSWCWRLRPKFVWTIMGRRTSDSVKCVDLIDFDLHTPKWFREWAPSHFFSQNPDHDQ